MARPLQKKKNKSSLHRVRQKPKSKRLNIKSNPIVAANWDQTQTLSQNYHRLGLSSKLNAHTGGTAYKVTKPTTTTPSTSLAIPSSKLRKSLGEEEVKVRRDEATGRILSVEGRTVEERRRERNPLGDALNDLSDDDDDDEEGDEDDGEFTGIDDGEESNRGIIPQLVESALYEKRKRPRMQSEREREWCRRLVERWGEDWRGMSRDRKLNPMQQSEAEVRRRVGVWVGGREVGEGVA